MLLITNDYYFDSSMALFTSIFSPSLNAMTKASGKSFKRVLRSLTIS